MNYLQMELSLLNKIFKDINNLLKYKCVFVDPLNKKVYEDVLTFYYQFKKIPTKEEFFETVLDNNERKRFEEILNINDNYSFDFVYKNVLLNFSKAFLKSRLKLLETTEVDFDKLNALQFDFVKLKNLFNLDIREGSISSLSENSKNQYFQLKEKKFEFPKYGYSLIDAACGGFKPGELHVVMSGTGEGKSTFLLNVGANLFQAKRNVLYVSIENSQEQLKRRFDSLLTEISYEKLKTGNLTPEEEEKYLKFLEETKSSSNLFYIYDNPNCTVSDIYYKVNELSSKYKIDLIIVDYLGLIKHEKRPSSIWEDVGEESFNLRVLAREFKTAILTASQVGREALKAKKENIYNLENIALSILIANNCDVLISLKINNPEVLEISSVCEINGAIVKNRDGPKTKFTLICDFDKFKMKEKGLNF